MLRYNPVSLIKSIIERMAIFGSNADKVVTVNCFKKICERYTMEQNELDYQLNLTRRALSTCEIMCPIYSL